MSVYVFKRKNSCTAKINVIFILCRLIVTDQPNSNQRKWKQFQVNENIVIG